MEGLKEILNAVQAGEHAQLLLGPDGSPVVFNGQHFTTKPIVPLPEKPVDEPQVLRVGTLSGLIAYLAKIQATERFEPLFVHVENAALVSVRGTLVEQMTRRTYIQAVYHAPKVQGFEYNRYCSQEQMMIALLALFESSESLAEVVKRIGNLAAETVKTSTDDGVTQQVIVRTGLRNEAANVPGLVRLSPFSTFAEVEQPTRRFLLRLQGAKEGQLPQCGLWEADNGAWENKGQQSIRAFLANAFKAAGVSVEIIA